LIPLFFPNANLFFYGIFGVIMIFSDFPEEVRRQLCRHRRSGKLEEK